jgi:phenylalanyl-tRNA synthetase beta chain
VRISLDWLQQLVHLDQTPEDLAHMLTMAGFEVEDIEDRSTWADGVVVGKIVEYAKHPDADKLGVCQVDIGSGEHQQIVCGAANARAGLYVAVATIGSYLPCVDLTLKPTKLRGVPSNGMICSLSEVGLAKESEGIHEFYDENSATASDATTAEWTSKIGADVRPLLDLTDVVIDLTATANRADAQNMVGVAREVAALTGQELRLPTGNTVSPDGSDPIALAAIDATACPAYIGTTISGVTIAPSPDWLQRRLDAMGIRPINNVVDITNLVMLEWGQPLHAFDRDRLATVAGTDRLDLGVRLAKAGETIVTLDEKDRSLSDTSLVITANDQPVALGGVMGGAATEVHDGTTSLMLEAALFEPPAIRRSARGVGMRTDASGRYERGVNFAELEVACDRAVSLIVELTGGTVTGRAIVDTRPSLTRAIELRVSRVREILGQIKTADGTGELPTAEMERILQSLSFELTANGNDGWTVTVPDYRARDIEREIDLIEEIARVYGYDNFAETLPIQSARGYLSTEYTLQRQVREAFRAAGLTELMHYSLVKPGLENQVTLANPLFAEYAAMRTELMPALIDAFQSNLQNGNGALNGFELGRVFWLDGEDYKEKDAIAGILGGDPRVNRWTTTGKETPMSWFDAKGLLESVFDRLGIELQYRPDAGCTRLHPGRTASLWLRGRELGKFGQLHPQLCQERELPREVYIFEFDLDLLFAALGQGNVQVPHFKPFSTFPASDRDLAFFVPIDASVSELEKAMFKAGGKLLEAVELFDEYRGDSVPQGQRSLAFRLVYRASDRTLQDKDVDPAHQKVRDLLVKRFKVDLRS